jgi:hypothetical protein
MPNWCDNTLTITHPDKSKLDAIDAVLSNKAGDQGLFNCILPNPSGEWDYEWSVNNWGTKWDASIHDWERQDDNTIWVSFDSAWSPPLALYEFMEENGYTVEAMYWEPGMGFCGRFADGYDDFYEYDITDRDSLENLPDELLDFTDLLNRHDDWLAEEEMEREQAEYEQTVTEWYPVEQNPHYVGFYETKEEGNWPFYKFAHWNGKKWTVDGKKPKFKIASWRGLNEDPSILTNENIDDTIENMMKDMGFEKA